jgi:hypothetical protein
MTQEPSADDVPSLPPPPEPPPSPPRPRRGRPLLWALAVLVVIAAAAGSAPYWLPLLPSGSDDRLAADETRLTQLEQQARQPPAEPEALATLRARVASLEARSAAAPDDTAAQQAASDGIQKLSARIDALEAKEAASLPQGDPQDAARLAAVADLRAALGGSGPYAAELAALRAMGPDPAALKPLEASAKTGIPDRALLAQQFRAETAPAIVAASAAAPAPEPEDFSDRVLARLEGVVTIRRVDGSDSPSAPALRETEAALEKGDLDAALEALKPLSGKEAEAAQPFAAQVQARLAAERAAGDLARQIEAKLAASGHP